MKSPTPKPYPLTGPQLAQTLGEVLLREHTTLPVLLLVVDATQEQVLDLRLESLASVSALMALHEKPFPTLNLTEKPA